ncbi:MAG: hypothetical protein ABII90_03105 [Bacteroidota bacterium]
MNYGFTLSDLVSHNVKHNEADGENNPDGTDDSNSWNCGAEGPGDEAEIGKMCIRQMKSLLALIFRGLHRLAFHHACLPPAVLCFSLHQQKINNE